MRIWEPGRWRTRHLLRLVPYLRRYRAQLILGTLMVFLTNLAAVISPWILRGAIDDLTLQVTARKLFLYASLILGVSLVEGFFRFWMRKILIGASRLIEFDLRGDLFQHLQKLTPNYYQKHPTGDLMARATNDLSAVRSVLGPGIMYSLNTLFTLVLTVGLLVGIAPGLALFTLLPLFAVSLCVKVFGKQIHRRFEQIQEQFSELTRLAQENVAGIRVVKAYNQESAFLDRFRTANQDYVSRSLSLVKVSGVFSPTLTFLLSLSSIGLLWYGGRQVISGAISLGDFVAFMSYLAMLTWPTIALGWVVNLVERGSASMGRINEILDTVPEIDPTDREFKEHIEGDIEIRNLDFSYNGRKVLDNINLRVRPGKTLAIVGGTGSGKSTLANLLCHLYVVPRNKISIDGRDINDIPSPTLRRAIGYVPQDTFLFSETVGQNIAFGQPGSPREEAEAAARLSQVAEDIEALPEGYETLVGERGITLSGGQKQRVAISRALLIDPPILILDDALSAVDTETEERILTHLRRKMKGRTSLLISHRVSTVKTADEIIVLGDGKIVERGTHESLMELGGTYSELYEKQLLREELGLG